MVKNSCANFNPDSLQKIYNTSFRRPAAKIERAVVFGGDASGAICFSAPYTVHIAGYKQRTQNILVVVGQKVLYAGGPSNQKYTGIHTVRVERAEPPHNPQAPADVLPLPVSTVFIELGGGSFVVANSKGLAFESKATRIQRDSSFGLTDIGSGLELDSRSNGTIFDVGQSLAMWVEASEIEKSQRLAMPIGATLAPLAFNSHYEEISERNAKLGEMAVDGHAQDAEFARRCVEIDDLVSNARSAKEEERAADFVRNLVDKTEGWSRDEFSAAIKKIKAQAARTKKNKAEIATAVIDLTARRREEGNS